MSARFIQCESFKSQQREMNQQAPRTYESNLRKENIKEAGGIFHREEAAEDQPRTEAATTPYG